MNDQTLSNDDQTEAPQNAESLVDELGRENIQSFLDLDEVLSAARRVERVGRICLRGDLESELGDVLGELSTLVDDQGEPVENETTMAEVSKIPALQARAAELRRQMKEAERSIRFCAMSSDEWDTFEASHRTGGRGEVKDITAYKIALIAACAVEPTMSVDQVKALRGKLGGHQVDALFNAAYAANTAGGIDVPKLPAFSQPRSRAQS
jgi:predicted phage tail protein